jgi:hypothetical protein
MTSLTHPTASTSDIEWNRDQVSFSEELDITTEFNDLASDFMPQRLTFRRGGASSYHVLIAPANISCHDLQDNAVFTFAIPPWYRCW